MIIHSSRFNSKPKKVIKEDKPVEPKKEQIEPVEIKENNDEIIGQDIIAKYLEEEEN